MDEKFISQFVVDVSAFKHTKVTKKELTFPHNV